ncbi:MAG: hypothetical protein OXQ90_03880 [Gammaproteobacteria bacterium]|nr:hypothetical protein [Gammaproteobacteria bacterium]
MTHPSLGFVAALCVAAFSSLAAEPFPVCGLTAGPAEGGCWQPLDGRRGCHVWNPNPQQEESAEFDGRSRCPDRKLTGTGTLTWRWTDDGESRSQTTTGPYSEGRAHGRFVVAEIGGFRAEGEYMHGEPHGHWVNNNPPGTLGLWDRFEGPWVDGVQQGNWVFADYEDVDGEFRETAREEGPFANGERHGDWDVVRRTFNVGHVGWSHQYGPYSEGKRQGRWVEVSHRATRAKYDARNAEAVHRSEREEGQYAGGKRHGNWVIVKEWARNWGETLAETEEKRSIRREGPYKEGQRHGTWKARLSNGYQIVRNYTEGSIHGPYEARDADGSLLVAASLVDGKVTELRLPKAALPSIQRNGSARLPVLGGFGIGLGPDLAQLGQLRCGDDTCTNKALSALHSVLEGFEQSGVASRVDEVPRPITRGRLYFISVSPWIGISQVRAWLYFESTNACDQEKARIDGLLRQKYGECRDFRYEADSEYRTPIGQCDVNGLPVAVVQTSCTTRYSVDDDDWDALILSYGILDPGAREAVIGAWRERGEVRASEL